MGWLRRGKQFTIARLTQVALLLVSAADYHLDEVCWRNQGRVSLSWSWYSIIFFMRFDKKRLAKPANLD